MRRQITKEQGSGGPDFIRTGAENLDTIDMLHQKSHDFIEETMQSVKKQKKLVDYVKNKMLPKSDCGVLHDAKLEKERIEHEEILAEIQKEPPLRDPTEYYAELTALAKRFDLQMPDHKSCNEADTAQILLFCNSFSGSFQMYKKYTDLERTLKKIGFIQPPKSEKQLADEKFMRKWRKKAQKEKERAEEAKNQKNFAQIKAELRALRNMKEVELKEEDEIDSVLSMESDEDQERSSLFTPKPKSPKRQTLPTLSSPRVSHGPRSPESHCDTFSPATPREKESIVKLPRTAVRPAKTGGQLTTVNLRSKPTFLTHDESTDSADRRYLASQPTHFQTKTTSFYQSP